MVDLDRALHLLENKVRRDILERLVREPHYPLQLAEQIGVSQQAIMKHLKLLKDDGFVDCEKVPSNKGGPPKQIYMVKRAFSMRIDLGPDLFHVEKRQLPKGGPMRLSNSLPKEIVPYAEHVSGRRKIPFGEAIGLLGELHLALDKLDVQRDAIISLHQHVKHCASKVVDEEFETYEKRHIIHNMLENPRTEIDMGAISQQLNLGATQAEAIMDEVRTRILRTVAESKGTIVAAPQDTKLPWYAILGKSS